MSDIWLTPIPTAWRTPIGCTPDWHACQRRLRRSRRSRHAAAQNWIRHALSAGRTKPVFYYDIVADMPIVTSAFIVGLDYRQVRSEYRKAGDNVDSVGEFSRLVISFSPSAKSCVSTAYTAALF